MCCYKPKGKERLEDATVPKAPMGSVKAKKSQSLKKPKNKRKEPLAPTNLNNKKKSKKPRIQDTETNNNNEINK